MSEFRYSDRGDVLTGQLIAGDYDSVYWEKSEDRVLDRALEYVKDKFGEDMLPYLSVLDLGCGCGRLMPRFSALFSSVTGLEPDEERCDAAMELILDKGLENATALCMDLLEYVEEFPNQTFDVVLCSHVFQHMKHETACAILEGLKHVMGPDTVCLFTTTFTDERRNRYTEEYLQDGERNVLETDETGFDRAVDDPDKLAVCLFSRPWMERFFASCGLKTRIFQAYHFAGERDAKDDAAATDDPAQLAFARDAFYLCEPAEGTLLRKSCGPETASGKICYMQFFYVDAIESMNTSRIRKVQSSETEDIAEIRDAFATAEGFLYGGNLHFPAIRHFRNVSDRGLSSDRQLLSPVRRRAGERKPGAGGYLLRRFRIPASGAVCRRVLYDRRQAWIHRRAVRIRSQGMRPEELSKGLDLYHYGTQPLRQLRGSFNAVPRRGTLPLRYADRR